MDLNEIAMNLVPFPRLHYLVSSLTPLYTLSDVNIPTRRLVCCLAAPEAIFTPQLFRLPLELRILNSEVPQLTP